MGKKKSNPSFPKPNTHGLLATLTQVTLNALVWNANFPLVTEVQNQALNMLIYVWFKSDKLSSCYPCKTALLAIVQAIGQ